MTAQGETRRNYLVNELLSEQKVGQVTLRIVKGDITLAETEAIVNAANSHLQHGGGVAAAIARRGAARTSADRRECPWQAVPGLRGRRIPGHPALPVTTWQFRSGEGRASIIQFPCGRYGFPDGSVQSGDMSR